MRHVLTLASMLAAGAPAATTLDGRPVAADALRSTVVLFWRADCGPCLVELSDLAALRRAAAPLHVQPVVLDEAPDSPGPVTERLAKTGLSASDTLRASADPAELLTAYGGAPPRLPLAVAFDGAGKPCGRRTGFLGYDRLRAWARDCGGARAAGR